MTTANTEPRNFDGAQYVIPRLTQHQVDAMRALTPDADDARVMLGVGFGTELGALVEVGVR